jgi:Zn-dependent peptidase ImmA (M78 family)
MGRQIKVPITPEVLQWAIEQSGYGAEQLAHAIDVGPEVLESWISGETCPGLTTARNLAARLHRPLAALLLPHPPEPRDLRVEFRRPTGSRRELNPEERRYLRRAARLQEIISWLVQEMAIAAATIPSATIHHDSASVAGTVRDLLNVSASDQSAWSNTSTAFDEWRARLERIGCLVFLLPLGKDSCRGFSLWDDSAPVIAINTAWNESARIFTLFHETAHLVTRTSSACVESTRAHTNTDEVERWCERFSADLLMPAEDVEKALSGFGWHPGRQPASLRISSRVAGRYKVSLRAAVIRLIGLGAATWNLYDQIPAVADAKTKASGGLGRSRTQIREDQFGGRTTSLMIAGVEADVIGRSQVVELLDIPDASFEEIAHTQRVG